MNIKHEHRFALPIPFFSAVYLIQFLSSLRYVPKFLQRTSLATHRSRYKAKIPSARFARNPLSRHDFFPKKRAGNRKGHFWRSYWWGAGLPPAAAAAAVGAGAGDGDCVIAGAGDWRLQTGAEQRSSQRFTSFFNADTMVIFALFWVLGGVFESQT
jgi:hypothetical protein